MKSVLASYTLSLAVFIPTSGWMADRVVQGMLLKRSRLLRKHFIYEVAPQNPPGEVAPS